MSDRPSWYGYKHASSDKILDLGCGVAKVPGSIGVDLSHSSSADVVHDLDEMPYPFENETFDAVYMNHCIEHLASPKRTLEECLRICKPKASIFITMPHFTNAGSFGDVTHRRYFSYRLLLEIVKQLKQHDKHLVIKHMRITARIPFLTPLINLAPRFWEDYFCFIFTGRSLYYHLQVEKA